MRNPDLLVDYFKGNESKYCEAHVTLCRNLVGTTLICNKRKQTIVIVGPVWNFTARKEIPGWTKTGNYLYIYIYVLNPKKQRKNQQQEYSTTGVQHDQSLFAPARLESFHHMSPAFQLNIPLTCASCCWSL